jgi:chaperonin GroES
MSNRKIQIKSISAREIKTTLEPLNGYVLIHGLEPDEATTGGIILPQTAKETVRRGIVVAVGEGHILKSGHRVPLQVKIDDVVLFSPYGTETIDIDGSEITLAKESHILAALHGDPTTRPPKRPKQRPGSQAESLLLPPDDEDAAFGGFPGDPTTRPPRR